MNSRSIREISFVQKLTLNWGNGNVFRRAIALGDVDNDDDNELVIGSLTVGDITNTGKNSLIVVSSEGQCNIFMDLDKSVVAPAESAPNSVPSSPIMSDKPVPFSSHFATHVRTRSEADVTPVRSQMRRVASMEGIALDPVTRAPMLTPHPSTSQSTNSDHIALEALISPPVSRTASPITVQELTQPLPQPTQTPPPTHSQNHSVPVPAPTSLPTSPNTTVANITHTHIHDKSPMTTPSSSPTALRVSIAHAQAISKRTSATTSAQSTPLHSPLSSPGASPPTGNSQYLSGPGPGPNSTTNASAQSNVITGYSTGGSTSSSAAPSPMTSPKHPRRPPILVNTTPGPPGTATGANAAQGPVPLHLNLDDGQVKNSKSAPAPVDAKVLVPSFSQKIPSNISSVVITDINEDGKQELLVGTYDQTLFLFAFSCDEGSFYDAEAPSRPASPVEGARPEKPPEKIEKAERDRSEKKCLRLKKKWRLPGQVGSIHVCGSTAVVGLCEGTYITLDVKTGTMEYGYNGHRPNSLVKGFKPIITNMSGPLKTCPSKDKDCEEGERTLFATATLDGTIQLAELKRPPYWELKVGTGQLCALRLIDIDNNGQDEIVACWWDGTTLIVDKDRNIATFQFEDRVSAFLCGQYAVHREQNIACFVYVTLFGEIIVYYNIQIEGVAAQTLLDGHGEAAGWGGWDRRELPSLYQGILYGLSMRDSREYIAQLRAELAQAESESRELLARVQKQN